MMNDGDDALGTSDVARRLGVCPERVRQLERAGVLPAIAKTQGGVRIYSARAVEALRVQRAAGREKRK